MKRDLISITNSITQQTGVTENNQDGKKVLISNGYHRKYVIEQLVAGFKWNYAIK